MSQLSLGVIATSRKEHEQRLAIHPAHLERIDARLRRGLYIENGYGADFAVPGDRLAGLRAHDELNEMAGYCSVLHAPQLAGLTGQCGRPLRAAVISFGATGRGAVAGLNALGMRDVHDA